MTDDSSLQRWVDAGLFDAEADNADETREVLEFFDSIGIDPSDYEGIDPIDLVAKVGIGVVRPGPRLTAREVIAETGLSESSFERLCRSTGYAFDGEFTDQDVKAFKGFALGMELFTEDALNDFARMLASSMARVADATTALFRVDIATQLEAMGSRDVHYARKNHELAHLFGSIGGAMQAFFLNQLTDAVRLGDRGRRASTSGSLTTINVAVGFVDIVGYTQLSASLEPDELATYIREFEARATALVSDHGGRLVKLIGDAVMFVAVEATEALAVAHGILEAFDGTAALPRAGVACGEVIALGGDYYGDVVNLASRIADLAVPGEVLCDETTATRAPTRDFDAAGRRQLKGFAEPIALFSLRR